ncbi:ADP-ribosyltransferase [Methanimicrococcus hongohii]|uniref:ADP-ribosyltransferase n=1 Tax=Methanimicrococcus hongohii TaxID=3028295 RepID=UPI002930DFB0|nr:ADP-ribosyltransferase [Methanimicrococcus sp. Hf6]
MTTFEKVCIGNYQDKHSWNEQKIDWSFDLPETWKSKPWCYAMNNCCRFLKFKKNLMKEERELIEFNIKNIDNAIRKSRADKEYTVYRGVKDIDWIKNPSVDGTFTEDAFGSFTLDIYRAFEYTNSENPIIFQLKLKKGMNALYFDSSENEIVLPRKSTYIITKIENIFVEDFKKIVNIHHIEKIEEVKK